MKDILKLARQAGISVDKFGMGWNATSDTDGVDIEAFAALVRDAALEEAAVVFDDKAKQIRNIQGAFQRERKITRAAELQIDIIAAEDAADRIRALKEQSK